MGRFWPSPSPTKPPARCASGSGPWCRAEPRTTRPTVVHVSLLLRPPAAARRARRWRRSGPGFTPQFTIYDDDDQISILQGVYKQLGLDDKFMQHRAALSRISHAKSHKQSPEEMARAATDPTTTRLAVVYERYQAKLRESNALDFDDLLLEAVRLAAPRRRPRGSASTAATNS